MKVALALACLAAFVGAVYWLALGQTRDDVVAVAPPAPAPAARPASEPTGLRLREGHAGALSIGDELTGDVRTGEESALFTGEGASIRLGPDTQLVLRKRGEQGYEFFLAGGSLEAASDGPRLEFFGAGTTGFVRVENGAARLLSDGQGIIVAGERGNVLVANAGKELAVPAGQVTRLLAAKAPDQLWKLPAAKLLKVAWPRDTEIAVRKMRLTGTTAPGSLVRALKQKTFSDAEGRFSLELPLNEGVNSIQVTAEDLRGETQRAQTKMKVDTTPAEVGVETSPDMWRKR